MSSGFQDREDGFETKFKLEGEQRFRAMARRNKMLASWAGEKMGMSAEEIEAYQKAVIHADMEEVGDDDVFRKIRGDLDAKGIVVEDTEIRATMDRLLDEAAKSVSEG